MGDRNSAFGCSRLPPVCLKAPPLLRNLSWKRAWPKSCRVRSKVPPDSGLNNQQANFSDTDPWKVKGARSTQCRNHSTLGSAYIHWSSYGRGCSHVANQNRMGKRSDKKSHDWGISLQQTYYSFCWNRIKGVDCQPFPHPQGLCAPQTSFLKALTERFLPRCKISFGNRYLYW